MIALRLPVMIEFIRPVYRPPAARAHPRTGTVVDGPAAFRAALAEPAEKMIFEHGPALSPEDIMVLAEAAASVSLSLSVPYEDSDDDLPAPYLEAFAEGQHPAGENIDRRE